MANVVPNAYKKTLLDPLTAKTLKVMLLTSSFTPNIDTQQYQSDLTNEVVGTGYVAGGATLANKSVTKDNTNDIGYLDADDTTWAASTITARYAALVDATSGVASTNPIVAIFDFTTDRSSSSDTFYIMWAALGLLKLA